MLVIIEVVSQAYKLVIKAPGKLQESPAYFQIFTVCKFLIHEDLKLTCTRVKTKRRAACGTSACSCMFCVEVERDDFAFRDKVWSLCTSRPSWVIFGLVYVHPLKMCPPWCT